MRNPIEAYRRAQRELRREFDKFTRANCATCPTPCCVQPARIVPSDILLAEATGWKPPFPTDEIVAKVAARNADSLYIPLEPAEFNVGEPCEFLGEHGCAFPDDLRPFGCTTFICRYMYERLDRKSLTRLKRLIRDLESHHRNLRP